MIDRILGESEVDPIIILQSDHGTDLGRVWNPSHSHLVYFEIMNAFYWPGAPAGTIPSDITPVNTFRLLFNTYFGSRLELFENRHWDIPEGYDDVFQMVPVDPEDVIAHPDQFR